MSAKSRLLFLIAVLLVDHLAPVAYGASTRVSTRSTNTRDLVEGARSVLAANKRESSYGKILLGDDVCKTDGDIIYYCTDGYYCCLDDEHCCTGSSATFSAPFFMVVAGLALATFQLQ